MYLEKLKILGFKSFAKKTTFELMNGITGIVGPNGCGKSNVVDAIRWVLGEQKAGTLRSERMENVIFNGTKELKPLGMAEVSLTIQNTKNILPVEYSEVVITRRLFRSGESQYLLNNSVCRLKDITDLLMDTGMAADAYSVIELSMVESILSGKPEERRRIFEEAAGVTKYKQRRKITFRKLESTENDLIRVEDIISEVEHKVNSLRRQVQRAQRYQTLIDQLKERDIRIATHKYSKIYKELAPLTEQLEEKQRERESNVAQISFKDAEAESLRTELIQIEQNLRSSQQELNNINDLIRKKEEEILISRERSKSLTNNNLRLKVEIDQLQQKIDNGNETLKNLTFDLEKVQEKIADEENKYTQEEKALEAVERQLQITREQAKRAENERLGLFTQVSQQQGSIEHLKATFQHLNDRNTNLQSEKATETEKILSYEKQSQSLKKFIEEKTAIIETLTSTLQQLTQQIEKTVADIETLKEEIVKDHGQLDALQHRLAILNRLLENYADYPEGVQHLMVENKNNIGTLANIISVDDKYRSAIETALGEAATYLVVTDSEQAFIGINSLKESRKGIVTFLPLNKFSDENHNHPAIDLSSIQNDEILGWADELINCEPRYRFLTNKLLGDYLVVTDLTITKQYPQLISSNSINIVSLSGDMIAHWGGIKGGRKSYDDAGFIGRRDQQKKFLQQITKLEEKLRQSEEKKQQLEQLKETAINKKENVLQKINSLEKELTQLKIDLSQNEYKKNQSRQQIEKIDNEIISITEKMSYTQIKVDELTTEIEQRQEIRTSKEEGIFKLNEEIDSLVAKRDALSQKVHQQNLNLVQLKNEAKNFQRELERSNQIISESGNSINSKTNELLENKKQAEQLAVRIDDLSSSLVEDYDQKEKLEGIVSSVEEKQKSLKVTIEEREKILRQLRATREATSDMIHRLELRIAELKLNGDNLYRRIVEEYNWDLKEEPIDELYDRQVEEQHIEQLKQRIKSLGPVNLLALKEYESEKERLDFLTKQHDDLIEAKKNLNETVTHINRTARQKFGEVFQKIRTNFSEVFQRFFEAGEADLVISEEEDPLEANIEIIANPKGKRPTSLTLLSGGEKALTAISLLFAIYLVKPSPFCILDEVDAPLDDANIGRFTSALRRFSTGTQFIIVTHNKLTMKAADSLYGITLTDSGISQVVSVRLD